MFQAVHEQLPEQPVLRTLNPQQNAMVTTISEIIIPQTDTPGAKAARVNEFIDLILTEWYDDEEKSIFLTGLAEVDTRTRDLFGKDFLIVERNCKPRFFELWMTKWLKRAPRYEEEAAVGVRRSEISFL
jgi:hypothetical protein